MTNQSELDIKDTHRLIDVPFFGGVWVVMDMAQYYQQLEDYITANYTPNTEVMRLRLEQAAKRANLDDAIRKFKAYCEGQGDFDELDLKEAAIMHAVDILSALMGAIGPTATRGEIVALINNRRKDLIA